MLDPVHQATVPIARGNALGNPRETAAFLTAALRRFDDERFGCLFLTNRNQIIEYKTLFRGTIDIATVHVRPVITEALQRNAASVVFAHNHPSGVAEPSRADRAITKRLVEALSLVEIKVLDHIVIGDGDTVSFAERGWL